MTTDNTNAAPGEKRQPTGRIERLRHELAAVFDDDLHTRQWHNLADYLIIGIILLSTLEVFLSTFDIDPRLRRVLLWVDIFTLVFFTVEVSLRIWVAPLVNPRFKGWRGRLRYCFTFHGFIDVISTYPFYLQWIIPFPIGWMRVLRMSRTVRLFRISRYMKSWRLLTGAIMEKKRELLISMQFLLIVTFILSLILFFAEHDAQPDVYDNGFASVLWAFAQYIGDPGGFGDTPPVTVLGRIIACMVGLLGIAIVAVPAGILGAGFTEAIERENEKELMGANREKLRLSFERKLDRPSGIQTVPPYRTITHIQAHQGMTSDEIIRIVKETPGYRLVNLASTIPIDKSPIDTLAVEHFDYNRPYGLCIDRGSRMTIVAPSGMVDNCTSFFAYYLAAIGGFNIVSREFGSTAPYRSFYAPGAGEPVEGEQEYMDDLTALLSRPGAWSLTFIVASGANEPEYPTQVHFGTGNAKGDESTGNLVSDKNRFERFYNDLSTKLLNDLSIKTDCGRYHSTTSKNLFVRKLGLTGDGRNHIVMRVAWSAMLWDTRRIVLAREIAAAVNRDILDLPGNPDNPRLKVKDIGYK